MMHNSTSIETFRRTLADLGVTVRLVAPAYDASDDADDALWRRTKQGMWLNADQQSRVSQWLVEYTQQKLSLAS